MNTYNLIYYKNNDIYESKIKAADDSEALKMVADKCRLIDWNNFDRWESYTNFELKNILDTSREIIPLSLKLGNKKIYENKEKYKYMAEKLSKQDIKSILAEAYDTYDDISIYDEDNYTWDDDTKNLNLDVYDADEFIQLAEIDPTIFNLDETHKAKYIYDAVDNTGESYTKTFGVEFEDGSFAVIGLDSTHFCNDKEEMLKAIGLDYDDLTEGCNKLHESLSFEETQKLIKYGKAKGFNTINDLNLEANKEGLTIEELFKKWDNENLEKNITPKKENKKCSKCGRTLNDAGECIVCDLGESETDYPLHEAMTKEESDFKQKLLNQKWFKAKDILRILNSFDIKLVDKGEPVVIDRKNNVIKVSRDINPSKLFFILRLELNRNMYKIDDNFIAELSKDPFFKDFAKETLETLVKIYIDNSNDDLTLENLKEYLEADETWGNFILDNLDYLNRRTAGDLAKKDKNFVNTCKEYSYQEIGKEYLDGVSPKAVMEETFFLDDIKDNRDEIIDEIMNRYDYTKSEKMSSGMNECLKEDTKKEVSREDRIKKYKNYAKLEEDADIEYANIKNEPFFRTCYYYGIKPEILDEDLKSVAVEYNKKEENLK